MISSMTAKLLGIEPYISTAPVELRNFTNGGEVEAVICTAYRQIFGNDHIMKSQRLTSVESLLKNGNISVRDFIRALGFSPLYREKFFDRMYQIRFIELNFKHFLGRTPINQAEISEHVQLFHEQGYAAEISSYIDSVEYQNKFGDNIVPYHQGFSTQVGQTTLGFNRMFQLYQGYASSDGAQRSRKGYLTEELALNVASPVRTSTLGNELVGTAGGSRGQLYRIRVSQSSSTRTTQIRRCVSEYLVAYEQLSTTMQRLNQRGTRIINITTV